MTRCCRSTAMLIMPALLFKSVPVTAQDAPAADPLHEVNVFVGTDAGGNTVPGASTPFGFVNLSPDTTGGSTNGYDSRTPLTGFSFTHVSGTGGNSKYGNFRVTPTIGDVDPRNLAFARAGETGAPGYYRTIIGEGAKAIRTELTATRLAGMIRVSFPAAEHANLLLDVTSAVQLMGNGPRATAAHLQFTDPQTMTGWASFTGGWNEAPMKLYFAASLDRAPTLSGSWHATRGAMTLLPGGHAVDGGDQRVDASNRLGGWATFDTRTARTVQLKLGISFVSEAKARENLNTEIPDWDFDRVRAGTAAAWGAALSKIEVEGGTPDQRRNFYSALYRSHTMPHDLTGDNVWWQSTEPHYEDYYTLWDTFRTLHPLLTLIQPQRQRDMIRSLIDTYRHTGWMPDARIAGANGMTQGGTNGDVLIADAVVKGLGGFDVATAYAALIRNGDVESANPINEGRTLADYLRLGYVSETETRSASRTLEYAYNDFAISQVARALGHDADAARFLKRSANWRNLWDKDLRCIRPRHANGTWMANFDCRHLYPDNRTAWWDAPFYEGSSAQYSTYVPHDVAVLIGQVGGDAAFVAWLDDLFDSGGYEQGNEPDFLAAYLYIHAGRPDRTAERIQRIMADEYRPASDGLPGNDDAGAMSSWYVWSAIGLFPNAGQPFYYIGSPIFARSRIALEGGRNFEVRAPAASAANRYVIGARLNGQKIDRAWITHDEIAGGGMLELEMGPKPGGWATRFSGPPNRYAPPT